MNNQQILLGAGLIGGLLLLTSAAPAPKKKPPRPYIPDTIDPNSVPGWMDGIKSHIDDFGNVYDAFDNLVGTIQEMKDNKQRENEMKQAINEAYS